MGQQVTDLVAQVVPPSAVPPEVVAGAPSSTPDSREGETIIKYDLTVHCPSSTRCRPAAAETFRIDYTVESPYGNDSRTRRGRHRPVLSRRASGVRDQRYVQASKQVAPRVNVTLADASTTTPCCRRPSSVRAGRQGAPQRRVSWNSSVATYCQQPAFLFVSAFPQNASLVPWRADK